MDDTMVAMTTSDRRRGRGEREGRRGTVDGIHLQGSNRKEDTSNFEFVLHVFEFGEGIDGDPIGITVKEEFESRSSFRWEVETLWRRFMKVACVLRVVVKVD